MITRMVDIIVPTYENEELTVECFNSIKKYTKPGTYRIIWVDNGSENIKKVVESLDGMDGTCIFLQENVGFVRAINEGLKVSDADTVCFLNNDVIVSDRWLEKLTSILYSNKKIGMVGSLTESVGRHGVDSGQNIVVQGLQLELPNYLCTGDRDKDLAKFNKDIEKMYDGKVCDPPGFIAFLCAVIKREVINKISESAFRYQNGLDENYYMGMWDDNDYNKAMRRAGYYPVLALDTCIYHRGRSTFDLIQRKEGFNVEVLLRRNKAYLDKMWKK